MADTGAPLELELLPLDGTRTPEVTINNNMQAINAAAGGATSAVITWTAPTFTNSWVNFGAPYGNAGYKRIGGRVWLKGMIKSGTVDQSAFTLPLGYRPADRTVLMCISNNAVGRLDINTDGTVVPGGGVSIISNSFVSLDGLSFPHA